MACSAVTAPNPVRSQRVLSGRWHTELAPSAWNRLLSSVLFQGWQGHFLRWPGSQAIATGTSGLCHRLAWCDGGLRGGPTHPDHW